ncbi:peptidase M19 [Planctomycetaceae bacterium SCGC AG-212-F19]|nr:peptidase M19 [Planctomycetaceae bacterium SCGC AG-212-F19]
MLVFDAHLDLAWNALDWNRDLLQPVAEIRRREKEQGMTDKGRCCNTVSFPELRRGNIGIFIATLLARLLRIGAMPAIQRYASMEAAYAAAYGQLAYYRSLEQQGILRWIKDWPSLEAHVKSWENGTADKQPLGFILSMEGADPVLSPGQVEEWYNAGLRIIGPAHYGPSPYARGHDLVGGLFEKGPALLREMERVGMILDVTHLTDGCFFAALDIYGGPILASHHNCRALVPNPRQLTDEQIKRIVARGGVIGAALDTWMMVPGWIRGETTPAKAGAVLEKMVDHIDHVCQIAGSAKHSAIGTDLDGGFGREQSPSDLDTIADLQKLPDLLGKRGYKADAIQGIMHGNWVRFFKEAWTKGT